ncbi:hypothetical protein Tsubulata_050177 [Turnera subulata]|uniref:Tim44-like domain-containing protein n=1 Tax=Turnera subulata TaxID=218843 RepID=A0A9Q0J4X6_9ROSI|nr:hypothetical protein Tsubulata_050177 [Turnera subulata]
MFQPMLKKRSLQPQKRSKSLFGSEKRNLQSPVVHRRKMVLAKKIVERLHLVKRQPNRIRVLMQSHPMFKRFSDIGEPVVTKSQEVCAIPLLQIAEDMREKWETSDNPIVLLFFPLLPISFSLVDFVAEVQEAVRGSYCLHEDACFVQGDTETLKKYCSDDVIKRCEAERRVYQNHGIFFYNKILHISEVDVTDTKMLGTTPMILVSFRTQQVHCVRDQHGQITEGSQDTIHTVFQAWAMEQVDPQELGEGAIYPIWKLKEIHQEGIQALI